MSLKKIAIIAMALGVLLMVGAAGAMMFAVTGMRRSISEHAAKQISFSAGGQPFVARLAPKPDGALVLEVVDQATGNVAIRSTVSANPVMRFFIEEDQGIVWFSNDAGMHLYARDAANGWSETSWAPGAISTAHPIPEVVFVRLSQCAQQELADHRVKPAPTVPPR